MVEVLVRRRFLAVAGAAAAAGLGALAYGSLVEPRRMEFTSQPIPRRRGGTTPIPSMAQVSDLHLKAIGDHHHKIAAEIADRAPSMIFITGDSVDSSRALPVFEEFLSLLPYSIPKYAILGNWEHWGEVDMSRLSAAYERANGTLLVNRSVEHKTSAGAVRISGVDDLIGGTPDLETLMDREVGSDFHVLLAHCPAHRDRIVAESTSVDMVLSGHTHGGQIQLLGHAPLTPPGSGRYVEGWYQDGGPPMYVSRGVGTSVMPIRFGARPEVTFFTTATP
jgi:uncharacterized protein